MTLHLVREMSRRVDELAAGDVLVLPSQRRVTVERVDEYGDLRIVRWWRHNTFERTSGNRARDAQLQPGDTVHGTLDRALVLANREHGVPRDVERESAQTICTGGGGGLGVVHLRQHEDVRRLEDPLGTVSAGGSHHGIIVRNNTARGDQGQMSTPAHEPFRTLTGRCHQSLVIPYQSEPHGEHEPARTITTRDRLALVVPPSSNGAARDAHTAPSFVQVTETRPMLVEINSAPETPA